VANRTIVALSTFTTHDVVSSQSLGNQWCSKQNHSEVQQTQLNSYSECITFQFPGRHRQKLKLASVRRLAWWPTDALSRSFSHSPTDSLGKIFEVIGRLLTVLVGVYLVLANTTISEHAFT